MRLAIIIVHITMIHRIILIPMEAMKEMMRSWREEDFQISPW